MSGARLRGARLRGARLKGQPDLIRSVYKYGPQPNGLRLCKAVRDLIFPVLLGCLFSMSAECAEEPGNYLVVGSYEDELRATETGERLSGEAGVEVLMLPVDVSGQIYYRLLVRLFTDEYDQARLKSQLRYAGVGDMWNTSITGSEPGLRSVFAVIDYEDVDLDLGLDVDIGFDIDSTSALAESFLQPTRLVKKNFLTAGSFRDAEQAEELYQELSADYEQVLVKSANVNGVDYYRVLVGPVDESSEEAFKAAARDRGIVNAWILRDVAVEVIEPSVAVDAGSDFREELHNITPSKTRMTSPDISRSQASPEDKEPATYNAAKLRKEPSPFFLNEIQPTGENNGRWRTDFAGEFRAFDKPGINDLDRNHGSISFQSEYYKTWNDGDDIFAFVPFARWDEHDDERTHLDIRELTWVHVADSWEVRTGIRKVFWGVTESQHLVDIINQTDNLENPDGEEKLGQPMINLSLLGSWGVLDFYVLAGFRERSFPGIDGRPRLPFLVDEDAAIFESAAEEWRTDFAIRWVQTFGELELGLSHFSGTTREPRFDLQLVTNSMGMPVDVVLVPVYEVIEQTGVDAQYFVGDWAWKLEAISRGGQQERYSAATFGFEKTIVGVFGSRADLGVIAEYLYDDRGEGAPVIGEDDVALGLRYAFNNVSDTTALLVGLYDIDSHELVTTLEASSRLGANWKIIVEASIFSNGKTMQENFRGFLAVLANPETGLDFFQDEDFLKIELIRYF